MSDPPDVHELKEDLRSAFVNRVGDLAPALDLRLRVGAGDVRVAQTVGARRGAFGDDQPCASALRVVLRHQVVRHVVDRTAASHRRHHRAVFQLHLAERERGEKVGKVVHRSISSAGPRRGGRVAGVCHGTLRAGAQKLGSSGTLSIPRSKSKSWGRSVMRAAFGPDAGPAHAKSGSYSDPRRCNLGFFDVHCGSRKGSDRWYTCPPPQRCARSRLPGLRCPPPPRGLRRASPFASRRTRRRLGRSRAVPVPTR